MWLAVDCGNSRIKWAAVQNGRAAKVRTAAVAPKRASLLQLRKAAAEASEAWVSHVGAALSRDELRGVLRECKQVRFVRSVAAGGGVVNRYRPPSSLGVDRWLALVAARKLRRDVAVVGAGTAATIDFLRGDGEFLGGAVLPGIHLSRETTARRTGLPISENARMILPPQNTKAALAAGAVSAVAGAALFLRRRILPGARFVVGGGDAKLLLPWLPKTAAYIPHPPICGLVRLHSLRS